MLPMKRCKKCDNIFKSSKFGPRVSCPRCGSGIVVDASAADIAFYNKSNKKK